MTFKEFNLIEPLLKEIDQMGYSEPTPIQQQAIPLLLQKRDLIGCAQTGTGKTAAFALPILQNLAETRSHGSESQWLFDILWKASLPYDAEPGAVKLRSLGSFTLGHYGEYLPVMLNNISVIFPLVWQQALAAVFVAVVQIGEIAPAIFTQYV